MLEFSIGEDGCLMSGNEPIICYETGKKLTTHDLDSKGNIFVDYRGRPYSWQAVKKYFHLCCDCGRWFHWHDMELFIDEHFVFKKDDGEWVFDLYICPKCFAKRYHQCSCCELYVADTDLQYETIYGVGRVPVCKNCLESIDFPYVRCDKCGKLFHEDTVEKFIKEKHEGAVYAHLKSSINVCPNCFDKEYYQCDCCKDYYHKSELNNKILYNAGSIRICNSCLEGQYWRCKKCKEVFSVENDLDPLIEKLFGDEDYENAKWMYELSMCPYCFEKYYHQCDCCHKYFQSSKLYVERVLGEGVMYICKSCLESKFVRQEDEPRLVPVENTNGED